MKSIKPYHLPCKIIVIIIGKFNKDIFNFQFPKNINHKQTGLKK